MEADMLHQFNPTTGRFENVPDEVLIAQAVEDAIGLLTIGGMSERNAIFHAAQGLKLSAEEFDIAEQRFSTNTLVMRNHYDQFFGEEAMA